MAPKLTSCSESLELDPIGVSIAPRSRVAGIAGFPGALSEDTLNDVVLEADICQPFLDLGNQLTADNLSLGYIGAQLYWGIRYVT